MGKARNGGVAYYNNIGFSSCPLTMAQWSKWSLTNGAERWGKPPPHSLYFLHRYYHSQVQIAKRFLPHPQSNSFSRVRACLHTIKVRMFYNSNLILITDHCKRDFDIDTLAHNKYMTKTIALQHSSSKWVSVLLGHERVSDSHGLLGTIWIHKTRTRVTTVGQQQVWQINKTLYVVGDSRQER